MDIISINPVDVTLGIKYKNLIEQAFLNAKTY